jgi:hypothetical protein
VCHAEICHCAAWHVVRAIRTLECTLKVAHSHGALPSKNSQMGFKGAGETSQSRTCHTTFILVFAVVAGHWRANWRTKTVAADRNPQISVWSSFERELI